MEEAMLQKEVELHLATKQELYKSFMSFVKGGGLFIQSRNQVQMGEEVVLKLKLMDEPAVYTLPSKIVWITPRGAQGGMPPGYGVQFQESSESLSVRKKIETFLAGTAQSDKLTDTM